MTEQCLRLGGIGGARPVELVEDLGNGLARVRILASGNTRVVKTSRIQGWRDASREAASTPAAARPAATLPPMMRASQLLPPPRAELRPVPKPQGPARAPKYLAFVRLKPCLLCGAPGPSHAHHHGPRGTGQKTDDYRTIPLCAADHDGYHGGHRPQLTAQFVAHAQRELLVEYLRHLEGT